MHANLRSFIDTLRRERQVIDIEAEVDPRLELAEIHRRVIEQEGPALFFHKIKGSPFPVVTNLFGTRRRVDLAVGSRPERIVERVTAAIPALLPPRLATIWQERDWLWSMTHVGLRSMPAGTAPVLEVSENPVDLTRLPVLTSWPDDGGPFLTQPLVYTEHPVTHAHNLGMYRVQIHTAALTGMHWQIHKGGGFHHYAAEQAGQELPVTIFLGGPPALTLAAIAPLPESLPELIFCSFLMGEKLPVAHLNNYSHPLVAEAEFAVCGTVPPNVRRPEGPFGDHYGYYSLAHDFPVLNVHRLFHRRDAIYPATVVGKPRQEDYFIGDYLQELLSPLFPLVMPGVRSLWTYAETGFHSLAAAVVRESYYREALAHALRILGESQLSLTKFLMVTDQQVDLRDFSRLLETVLKRFRPESDLIIMSETAMDTLDYTGRRLNHGSKAVMLGLGANERNLPAQYTGGSIPQINDVQVFCPGCLLIRGPDFAAAAQLGEYLVNFQGEALHDWPLVILVDEIAQATGRTGFLWQVFTRFDPGHDIYALRETRHNRLILHGPVVIDARMKPDYPAEVMPDEATVRLVDKRWKEYGIN